MRRRTARLWPALLALACGSRTAATEADGASDSGGGSTATGTASAVTEASAAASGTGDAGDAQASCAALCGAYDTCAPELGGMECLTTCVEGIAPPLEMACAAAWLQLYTCLAALDCEALLAEGSCPGEHATIESSCPGVGEPCTIEIDSTSAKRCSYQELCPDLPTRGLDCVNTTCTCVVDGVEGATCAADGICTNTGELGSKMLACCG